MELTTRDARIRTFLVLLTVLGVPLFMIWWQVTAMPLQEGVVAPSAAATDGGADVYTGDLVALDLASDAISTQHFETHSKANFDSNNNSHTTNTTILPKMVWLMSFPNSGTSYTMRMVASSSQRAIATNYGREVASRENPVNIPLYPTTSTEEPTGPFWRGIDEDDYDDELSRPLPDKYIITKTHCGGRCTRCTPNRYMLTLPQFVQECTRGEGCFALDVTDNATAAESKTCKSRVVHYPPPPNNPHLGKIIHLIRNPFDNIVSRYHLSRKSWQQRLKGKELEEWVELHPNNATGFLRWCDEMDTEYGSPFAQAIKNGYHDQEIVTSELPCQGEWFRYIQWHMLALDTIEMSELPSLTIFYEHYSSNWNATVESVLDFLEVHRPLPDPTAIREFVSRPPYDDYYNRKQRRQARALVKQLASKQVWKLLQNYF